MKASHNNKMEIIKNKYFGENIYISEYSCAFSGNTSFCLFEDKCSISMKKNNVTNLKVNKENERLDISSLLTNMNHEGVLFLLFDIETDKSSRVILNTLMPVKSKVFVNDALLTILGIDTLNYNKYRKTNDVCFVLNNGTNHFIVEILNPEPQVWINILLMNYEHEISEKYNSLSQIGSYSNYMDINYVCEQVFFYNSSEYCFMVMDNNDSFINEYEVYIYDQFGEFKLSFKSIFRKKERIDLLELSKDNNSFFINYHIIIKIIKKGGDYFIRSFLIVLQNPEDIIQYIQNIGNEYLHRQIDTYTANSIESTLNDIIYAYKNYGDMAAYINSYNLYYTVLVKDAGHKLLFDEIREKCENLHGNNKVKAATISSIEYCSEIDLCKERILIRLPHNYDIKQKYPIILNLAIGRYSWDAYKLENSDIINCFIYADISIRGQTLGGYMGEANFFESLSKIEEKYSIDKNRIYLQGASNGGYATWRLLGKFPHIFAAGYPLAAVPPINDINNMINIPIITLISDIDSAWLGKDILLYDEMFSKNMEYKQIDVKGIYHSQLINYIVNRKVLKFYFNKSLYIFPKKIIYRTNSNRYRKAYWIELHELCFGSREAVINAEFRGSCIDITIINSEGVDIIIPPQINKNNFIININNESFIFNDFYLSELHFRLNHSSEKYIWSDNLNNNHRPKSRKGYGLLDIYFDKLRIIIPNSCNQLVQQIAENLAHPHSNANDGEIAVSYPILIYCDVELEVWNNNSIICICCNDYLSNNLKPDHNQFINALKEGFTYMGNMYYGDYIVMQIVPNPVNEDYSILYIDFNNPDYIKKILFLRRMIISGELTGHHPYLNNEALVLLNGSYFSIYEWGEGLKHIHNI